MSKYMMTAEELNDLTRKIVYNPRAVARAERLAREAIKKKHLQLENGDHIISGVVGRKTGLRSGRRSQSSSRTKS